MHEWPKMNALAAISLMVIYLHMVYCVNIVREECGVQARFYKVASNSAMKDEGNMTKATNTGYMGCVDLCIEYPLCKAFNFKSFNNTDSVCELLHKDRTTNPNDIVSKNGWKYYDTGLFSSQIGQFCRSLTYNPCYPCLCVDSCLSSVGYTCKCAEGSPPTPDIYISFEKSIDGDATKSKYDRGKDMNGNSQVTMMNGANIGTSAGRPGKVLRMTGTNAGADAGYFYDHTLNNPRRVKISISLWLRIASLQSSRQTVFATGYKAEPFDTGFTLEVDSSANFFVGRVIYSQRKIYFKSTNMHDTLTTWSHIVFVADLDAQLLKIYVNGRVVGEKNNVHSNTASQTANPNLLFGGAGPTTNYYWGMHVDDFAFWNGHMLTKDEIVYLMNKGFVHNPE